MNGKLKPMQQLSEDVSGIRRNKAYMSTLYAYRADEEQKKNARWEEFGRRICSLKPEDFGLIKRPKVEISEELTCVDIVSNVLSFLNDVKRDVGNATEGTILSKTEELTAALCNVDDYAKRKIQMLKTSREISVTLETEQNVEERPFGGKTIETITAHEKKVLQEQLQELEERRRSARDRRNGIQNVPGENVMGSMDSSELFDQFSGMPEANETSKKSSRRRKRKMQEPMNAEQTILCQETMLKVAQNPFWESFGKNAENAERNSKLSRAIAEEIEKKRKKEEEAREKREKRWADLGEAVCNLTLDDFILPAELVEESDYYPPLNMRGEQVIVAVGQFVYSLKRLLGDKLTHETVISDQNEFAAALCGINHAAMAKRFSFRRRKPS